jgi:hypothetical protein
MLTNQNYIYRNVKNTFNWGNPFLPLALETMFFRLLTTYVEMQLQKKIMLCVVLYAREPLPVTVREEHRLRVF